ncbi:CaiB/BaiF CoA-transferase family protein [Cytobacillus sp. IB215665]|uniref:CaiB/BaiF CoA transferase family protein n=1 Tax=Cytobacillus sp. IB215665 TaxID=3097357 RepID=UPI002A0D4F34|nr:CaiB/BaiF CoA-transferase family protein [Cytobacillus sp. IB215665]MDX8366621.1 CaiB/BaiF CoA-transferase family protein [Cytobacillus sp. IB215665]
MPLLSSLNILDFSGLLPGPYATMFLADLGANILRVESPSRPDLLRMTPPIDGEDSVAHQYLNRSKRAIALDLKREESIDIVKKLIHKYDIVLEQFRPGVMDRLGLGYNELKQINPELIYCSLTGYGQTGPYRNRAGHDNNYLSVSGVTSYSSRKGSVPTPYGIQIADVAGGSHHTVIAILAAAYHRQLTGQGQSIDVSMTDAAFALNGISGAGYLASEVEPEREALMLNGGTFYDYYETKDGRYFSVGSLEPNFRKQLCEAVGAEELFSLSLSMSKDDMELFKDKLKDIFRLKTYEEWIPIFNKYDACIEPVLHFSEAVHHPQIKARNMIADVPKDEGGSQKQLACPIKFSSFQPSYSHIGSRLGYHTEEVLQELGLNESQISSYKKAGIIR